MRRKYEIVPPYMKLPLFLAVACNCTVYYGARLLTVGRIHYDMTNSLDRQIPFVPWTVLIYLGSYAFWIANYIIGCRQERDEAFRFISADFAAKLVCLLCFLAFPTTNVRPEVTGSSVWDGLMRLLYRADAADNLFPSIHCLTSWFGYIAVRKNRRVPGWYRALSLAAALAICVSTLTTKQHVLADVIGGILLAEAGWRFAAKSGFWRIYRNAVLRRC